MIEATGAKEPMRLALDLVAAAGRVIVVGLSSHEVPLRVGALPFRELDVLGVSCCRGPSSPWRPTWSRDTATRSRR